MRHHDVLGRVAQGSAVLLTEHSNSERGYLSEFAGRLEAELNIQAFVSERIETHWPFGAQADLQAIRRVRFFTSAKDAHLRSEILRALLTNEHFFIDNVVVVLWVVMEKGEAFHA